jgi:hypothetical protein
VLQGTDRRAAMVNTGARSLDGGAMDKQPTRHSQELRLIAADTVIAVALVTALYLAFDGLALLLAQ